MNALTKTEIQSIIDEQIGTVDEINVPADAQFKFFAWRWLDAWTQSSYQAWQRQPYGDYM